MMQHLSYERHTQNSMALLIGDGIKHIRSCYEIAGKDTSECSEHAVGPMLNNI